VRAGTIAYASEGCGESGVRVRVRPDVAGRYLPRHWTQPKGAFGSAVKKLLSDVCCEKTIVRCIL
jgi:hypothetical protein